MIRARTLIVEVKMENEKLLSENKEKVENS